MNLSDLFFCLRAVLAVYLCLYAPGRAWQHAPAAEKSPDLASCALSVTWTSLLGVLLTAIGAFSLNLLLATNAAVAAAGYVTGRRAGGRWRREGGAAAAAGLSRAARGDLARAGGVDEAPRQALHGLPGEYAP